MMKLVLMIVSNSDLDGMQWFVGEKGEDKDQLEQIVELAVRKEKVVKFRVEIKTKGLEVGLIQSQSFSIEVSSELNNPGV